MGRVTADDFYNIDDVAEILRISKNTIYRNPKKYHMFKVGKLWRATNDSLKKFELDCEAKNNVIQLAVYQGGGKEKCRYTKGAKTIGSTSHLQQEKELGDLLARRTKQKHKSITIR